MYVLILFDIYYHTWLKNNIKTTILQDLDVVTQK